MQAAAPQIEYVPYEPAEAGEPAACELVATYGEPESEYAAIRRGAGIFDSPHRGTILITGAERRDFLDRMVTQELKDLEAGVVKPTFWLNRKGRLEADLLLVELPERITTWPCMARRRAGSWPQPAAEPATRTPYGPGPSGSRASRWSWPAGTRRARSAWS
jgi:glycine cleavage system aminomethyltransferase T